MTDGDLVRQSLSGRREAYEELVRRWAARVLALCHAKTGRGDIAEDLAQEALMRGWAALASLSEPEKFGAWLHGIAVRTCLDWLKAKARTQVSFSDLAPDGDAENVLPGRDAEESRGLEEADEVRVLLSQVEALPEEYRKVIMLYYYEDVTYRDIAVMLGVSAATINARLTKARALLRHRLSRTRR